MHIIWIHGFIIWYYKSWFQISRLLFDISDPDFKSRVSDIINPGFISCVYDLKWRLHDLNLTFRFDISEIMI